MNLRRINVKSYFVCPCQSDFRTCHTQLVIANKSSERSTFSHSIEINVQFIATYNRLSLNIFLITFQVCNAVYVRLNYTQPLCACPARYRDPCSASLNADDLHTTRLTSDSKKRVSHCDFVLLTGLLMFERFIDQKETCIQS